MVSVPKADRSGAERSSGGRPKALGSRRTLAWVRAKVRAGASRETVLQALDVTEEELVKDAAACEKFERAVDQAMALRDIDRLRGPRRRRRE